MAVKRQLAIARRFSLADIAPDWTTDCYLTYRPGTLADAKRLEAIKTAGMSDNDATDEMFRFVKEHVTGGQGFLGDGDGVPSLGPLVVDDIDLLPPTTVVALFQEIMGAQFDNPKATPVAAVSESNPAK